MKTIIYAITILGNNNFIFIMPYLIILVETINNFFYSYHEILSRSPQA